MGTVIELNQYVLGACKDCGSTEWHIVLDKIEYTRLLGLNCAKCGAEIKMNSIIGGKNENKRLDKTDAIHLG